ncbi:MAG: dipeptidase PepE [Spirochaetaceae bacterium]|nr:MAG: dipeptidase PepE [Spirochaetaceae bacterium]
MRLLLLSNSTNAGEPYLGYSIGEIGRFLGSDDLAPLFIPYAAEMVSYDDYEAIAAGPFASVGQTLTSVHHAADPVVAVAAARAIVIGGGNSFRLLRQLQQQRILGPIGDVVRRGAPYVGWSAGSNVACPTIRTTNDMPIVEPAGFAALAFVPIQINPHYVSNVIPGHAGETRDGRIAEFLHANPDQVVIGLREGTMLRVEGARATIVGARPARVFRHDSAPVEIEPGSDLYQIVRSAPRG